MGEHGWLSTRFSFSFADWYDPNRMGFGVLRVLNDDTIAARNGFGMHGHRDMEIITIVTKGAVTHEDNMGNTGLVPAGDVQVMSAGTGVVHSERNDSSSESLELFQIWITPREKGIAPRYAQRSFSGINALLVSPDGREGSLAIMQDACITRVRVEPGMPFRYSLFSSGNGVYVFVVAGEVSIDETTLHTRDALEILDTEDFLVESVVSATLLIIEVPGV
jgi:redox-sensitive bicupin YhaK (pirin superfamily)